MELINCEGNKMSEENNQKPRFSKLSDIFTDEEVKGIMGRAVEWWDRNEERLSEALRSFETVLGEDDD